MKGAGVLQARDTNAQSTKGQSQTLKDAQTHSQSQAFKEFQSQAFKVSQSQMSPQAQPSQATSNVHVEDPYFVLGITKGTGRDE